MANTNLLGSCFYVSWPCGYAFKVRLLFLVCFFVLKDRFLKAFFFGSNPWDKRQGHERRALRQVSLTAAQWVFLVPGFCLIEVFFDGR